MSIDNENGARRPLGENLSKLHKDNRFAPVGLAERVTSVDVLRGVALLGILVINIDFYALPGFIFFDPSASGGFTGINLLTWKFGSLLFLQKMMAIFSMLFGAGLVLMNQRAEASGRRFRGVYYRRALWLLVIGLLHGYLLWYGDILFTYAVCALLLYPLRRRSPRLLIILGAVFLVLGILIQMGSGTSFGLLRQQAEIAEDLRNRGDTITLQQEEMIGIWNEIRENFVPSAESVEEETRVYQGSFLEIFRDRAEETFMMQTQALAFMMFWRVAGLMLLGMGLMKLGVFSAKRTRRFYIVLVAVGYSVGLPLAGYGSSQMIEHNFDFVYGFQAGLHFNYVGSILVALGHVGMVMIICLSGWLSWLTRRLAAVGRMALTNYLMHSIICTTIFYGYGFGLFGKIERFGLLGFVLAIWVVQLAISPIWLRNFRFGPAEWLWRSLTYWRRPSMKNTAELA